MGEVDLPCAQCDGSGQTAGCLPRVLGHMLVGNNIEQKLPLIIGEKRTASPRSSKSALGCSARTTR
jgi:hypothetical protein